MPDDPVERRQGYTDIPERITAIEVRCGNMDNRMNLISERLDGVSKRTHDLATPIAILVDGAERAARQHAEMLVEIRAARADSMIAITNHDRRDDERFTAHGNLLAALDKKDSISETQAIEREKYATRRTMFVLAVMGLLGSLLGAIIGGPILAHFLTGGH